jgi:hypothetical protein
MIVRCEVVCRPYHGLRSKPVKLGVELRRVHVKLYVHVDRQQPRDVWEHSVVEGRQVEHVVVVLLVERDAELK